MIEKEFLEFSQDKIKAITDELMKQGFLLENTKVAMLELIKNLEKEVNQTDAY